jgi:RND family efflux transporter MFP subunit
MKSALDRREQLLRQGAIAAEQVDNARRDFEVSQADLDAAKQQLNLVQEGPRNEEIRVGEEAVRQAEATLRDAEANRSRRKVSREDIQAAETEVARAESARDAAKDALANAQVNNDEIRNARALVNQARADVRYANDQIAQTRIYAPVSGIVTERTAHVGESVVQMRNDLMTLVSLDTLYFEATAPETVLPSLRVGQRVEVSLDATPGRTTPGVLRQIIPVATGTNRSVRLRISLPRPDANDAKQVVGGFARAVVGGGTAQPVLSVPRAALVSDEGQLGVFVAVDGKAKRREVRVADAGGVGDRVQIISGVRAGDKVIVRGAESLTNGQEVAAN